MTFYNIIFGLLFLASVREVISELIFPAGMFCEAVFLTLLIFSDVVYTSHVIEERKIFYNVFMKLIDLLNFLLLLAALCILNPSEENHNLIQLDLPTMPVWIFWLIITVYWFFLIIWMSEAKVHPTPNKIKRAIKSFCPGIRQEFQIGFIFLVNWGLVIGLIITVIATIVAVFKPLWMQIYCPIIIISEIFYLLFTALIFKAYEDDDAKIRDNK